MIVASPMHDSVAHSLAVTRTLAGRIAAAQKAAAADPNADKPFYWEIGNKDGKLASGTVGVGIDNTTSMNIASATKWMFGAYAAQDHVLSSTDWPFLTMTSGYKNMGGQCQSSDTVDLCLATGTYNVHSPSFDGIFFYNSGHFEHYASATLLLGADRIVALHTAFESMLGVSTIQWTQPLMAGGIYTTADCYAAFLRKILNGQLNIAAFLGTHQVPASALLGASNSPAPTDEPWHYSIGHWVEPDGTFSSGGSLGFYPWIDANRRTYGIVARNSLTGSDTGTIGIESVRTGQSIRAAWFRQ